MKRNHFSQKVKESMNHYVYCLVDPRNDKIFYVGEGVNDRVFDHAKAAITETTETEKLNLIREIISEGKEVGHFIIRHGMDIETAFEVEAALIDFLTYPHFNKDSIMANIVAGHHQWDRGIKTADEIEQTYAAEPLEVNPNHRILCVNLNRTYKKGNNIYDIARGDWPIAKNKCDKVDYVLAIYGGIVRGVYQPETWEEVITNDKMEKRWRFTGKEIIDSPYMNKDTRGIVNFIRKSYRYINL